MCKECIEHAMRLNRLFLFKNNYTPYLCIMFKRFKVNTFVIAIAISILFAYFFPQAGAANSFIPIDLVGSIGIALIFFFYGLSLSSEAIKSGLNNWRLHTVVQASSFILFPCIVLLFYPFFKDSPHELLWLAFLFLAALPSAVSSSVVMVSLAKGNLPAAIFNASISGIIGILFTPLWMNFFTQQADVEYHFAEIYWQLATEIVIPLTLGLLLRKYLGNFAQKHKRSQDIFDKFIVLLIIYKSFVHSFEDKVFASVSAKDLFIIFLIVAGLFFSMYTITGWIAKRLKFNHADSITVKYCGTKKSLIHGTVFSEALFGHTSIVGIILLPLMLYHAFQILVVSIFATKEAESFDRLKE